MSARDIVHAALLWHAAHVQRKEIGSEKRRLEKAIKATGNRYDRQLNSMQSDAAARLTPARRKELKALRALAKACEKQRSYLDRADVIDLDVRQLSGLPTTEHGADSWTTTS